MRGLRVAVLLAAAISCFLMLGAVIRYPEIVETIQPRRDSHSSKMAPIAAGGTMIDPSTKGSRIASIWLTSGILEGFSMSDISPLVFRTL